jgi:peptide/nickel transport system substrate-binding protein
VLQSTGALRARKEAEMSDQPDFLDERGAGSGSLTRAELLRRGAAAAAGISALGAVPAVAEAAGRATPKKGGILIWAISQASSSNTLDPLSQTVNFAAILDTLVYNSLFWYEDGTWKIHPSLAVASQHSRDFKTWEIRLRQGVEWHDGKPFTANDVAWTMRRWLTKSLGSALYGRLSPVLAPNGIHVVSPTLLRLQLKQPDPFLLLPLSQRDSRIVQDGVGKQRDKVNGVGTGPFKVKSFRPGISAEVVRNSNYWDHGKPYLDGVRLVVVPDDTTKVQSVISGNSHITDPVGAAVVPVLQAAGSKIQILAIRNGQSMAMVLDQTVAPFDNNLVRRAFKLAVDRQKLIQQGGFGLGSPAGDAYVSRDDPAFPNSLLNLPQRIDLARKALADAGHPDGIDVTAHTSEANGEKEFAVAFAAMVKDANIRVKIQEHDISTFFDKVWLQVPMYTSGDFSHRHPYEIMSLTLLPGAPYNEPKFSGKPQQDLANFFNLARKQNDVTKQNALLSKGIAVVAANSGYVVPYFRHVPFAAKPNLRGAKPATVPRVDVSAAWLA